MVEKKDLVGLKYGDQPEKWENHILIFDGIKGVREFASELASKLYHSLKKDGKNPVIYTSNDTVNPQKIEKMIITSKKDSDSFNNFCFINTIQFETILNDTQLEEYLKKN